MHHFFAEPTDINTEERTILLRDDNYRHLVQVLRGRVGEKILVSDGDGTDYQCEITEILPEAVELHIDFREEMHELPADIYLFQGLPKSDKMELIIQKAVELGARAIVPLETKNTVVKLEGKKSESKVKRWQAIAEAAAKQSKRSVIPEVLPVMGWRQAMDYVADFSCRLIPYENARDIRKTMAELQRLVTEDREARETEPKTLSRRKIGIFIGPEGGFTDSEIQAAMDHGIVPVTLGKRILRTETAAICALSIVMLTLESAAAETGEL